MAKARGAAGVRQFATKIQGTDNVHRSCPYPSTGPDPSLGPWTGPNSGPFQVTPELLLWLKRTRVDFVAWSPDTWHTDQMVPMDDFCWNYR